MSEEKIPRIVTCPKCKKPSAIGQPFAPFCSERCKLLDLGAWAKEEYKVKGEAADDASTGDAERGKENE